MSYRFGMAIVADLMAEFDYRLLIEPPAIVRAADNITSTDEYEKYQRFVEQRAHRLQKTLSVRDEAREIVWNAFPDGLSGQNLRDLDGWIAELDANIDQNTKSFINTAQHIKRAHKHMRGKIDKSKLAEFIYVFGRGQKIWSKELAETIDFATFLRAVRASKVAPSSTAQTFSNPAELTRYLEDAVGGVE